MATERDNTDCIVVRCFCKRIVFVAVNEPHVMDTEIFKDVGDLIRRGLNVEHMTVSEVRQSPFGCECDGKE